MYRVDRREQGDNWITYSPLVVYYLHARKVIMNGYLYFFAQENSDRGTGDFSTRCVSIN